MAEVDLHPDVVRAIQRVSKSSLGRKYDRWARGAHKLSGATLAGKTVAGEFGGRSTRSGRGVVSSAGARGPAQFIPSTRSSFQQRYGVDPWAGDVQAIKGLMLHQLNHGGLRGYNPGMPSYPGYIKGQKIDPRDLEALRAAARGRGGAGGGRQGGPGGTMELEGPTRTDVSLERQLIPGQSFAAERAEARADLLTSGDVNLKKLLEYKRSISGLQDIPAQVVSGDLSVKHTQGRKVRVRTRSAGGGSGAAPASEARGVARELFYRPGISADDGKRVGRNYSGVLAAPDRHERHVHVAFDNDHDRQQVIRMARDLGVAVGSTSRNTTTFHGQRLKSGKSRAVDFTGTPARLAKFNRMVARYFGVR